MGVIERAGMTFRGIRAIRSLPSERQIQVIGQTRTALSSLFTDLILPSMNPYEAVRQQLEAYSVPQQARIFVLGAGKAGVEMGRAVYDVFGTRAVGAINVPASEAGKVFSPNIELFPAGHPDPNEYSVLGAQRILELAGSATPNDIVIAVISGGGSALMALPAAGIPLEDYITVNQLLNRSGASIQDWNAVRKHIDMVKGGRLAAAAGNASEILNFMLSDVTGDRLDVIASGPFTMDPSTYSDALAVLEKYGIMGSVPKSIIDYLSSGNPETSKEVPGNLRQIVVASSTVAVDLAVAEVNRLGYRTTPQSVLHDVDVQNNLHGSARETAEYIAMIAGYRRNLHPDERFAIVIGGEPTVNVRAECPDFVDGKSFGGRMQHVAALLMPQISGLPFMVMCAATDCRDGYEPKGATKVAGAIINGFTYGEALRTGAKEEGLALYPSFVAALDQSGYRRYMRRGNTYGLHTALDTHLAPEIFVTNVMDLMILVHDPKLAQR